MTILANIWELSICYAFLIVPFPKIICVYGNTVFVYLIRRMSLTYSPIGIVTVHKRSAILPVKFVFVVLIV